MAVTAASAAMIPARGSTSRWAGPGLLYGLLALFFLSMLVLPLALMLSTAFQRIDTTTFQTVDRLTLHQFVKLFSDPYYFELILKTVRIAGQTTLGCLLIGYPFALHMWRASPRERQVLRLIVLSPLLISFVILNFGWIIILAPQGIANGLLKMMGLTRAPLAMLYTEGAVIVGLVHVHLPFMILAIGNALETVSSDTLKAGTSLGASRWQVFRHIIWPLSFNGVVSGSVIVFATTASSFVTPVLLGGSWVKMLATVAYQEIMGNLNLPFGSAISLVLLAMTATITFGLLKIAALFQPHLAGTKARTVQ